MTDLPNDTIAVYLAVRRPCDTTTDPSPCDGARRQPCSDDPDVLDICLGDGTRIVMTEVEVTRYIDHRSSPQPILWEQVGSMHPEVPRD